MQAAAMMQKIVRQFKRIDSVRTKLEAWIVTP
jgi:hypothetical protein